MVPLPAHEAILSPDGGAASCAVLVSAREHPGAYMTHALLTSDAVSAFCGAFAQMTAAGIQVEESACLLSTECAEGPFKDTCESVYRGVAAGKKLGTSMKESGAFPDLACNIVATGEKTGHLEEALQALDQYYDEEDRLFAKLRTNVRHPAIILCLMTAVLAVTNLLVLPAFASAYESVAGSLTSGSFALVGAAGVLGWIALILAFVCAVLAVVATVRIGSEEGRMKLARSLSRLPSVGQAFYQLALARFTLVLSAHISTGVDSDTALEQAAALVDHPVLKERVSTALADCIDLDHPKGLVEALASHDVFDPLYASMLEVGDRTASFDETLSRCAQVFFDDALDQLDRAVDSVEPALTILLTVAVGASLVAAMLPLVGIVQSIG